MDDNTIVLLNEEGQEEEFSIIDILIIDNIEYVIAQPLSDDEYDVVFRIDKENGEEILTLVDDDDELNMVSEAYYEEADIEEDE
jgi:uncharacterized protein YrzB (UPF0473 family)